jgi:hypothetical protein
VCAWPEMQLETNYLRPATESTQYFSGLSSIAQGCNFSSCVRLLIAGSPLSRVKVLFVFVRSYSSANAHARRLYDSSVESHAVNVRDVPGCWEVWMFCHREPGITTRSEGISILTAAQH